MKLRPRSTDALQLSQAHFKQILLAAGAGRPFDSVLFVPAASHGCVAGVPDEGR